MTPTLSFRYIELQLVLLVCMLLVPDLARAQTTADYCEPSPVIKAELKKVSQVHDEDLPYQARLARQKRMLQTLMGIYPNDFHVQRRYQDSRRAGFFTDMEPLIADYRA